ncbi:MAG: hypothetical protein BRD50_06480 [Bacteroidetes bacterium SW_11_45_7]|nr:MAG: hypothetical protein BRD50_06480 [Bacteroidetes bacterium SW_11_45_7]
MSAKKGFSEKCEDYLYKRWDDLFDKFEFSDFKEPLGKEKKLIESISSCLTSRTKSYHYVLPTQVLAKINNHSLDARSLQASYGFDARTIAHNVIVPFDQYNYNVLGGSSEPYVNNPLRHPAVTGEYREQQKNKTDWDLLVFVLDKIERKNSIAFTKKVFDQILFEIYRLLKEVKVLYATPNRISLDKALTIIKEFTSQKSGGDRVEAITTVLFQTLGERFHLFDNVLREKVNASDSSTGMAGDIECWSKGEIALLIEVKDKELTLTQLENTLNVARSNKISEVLFMLQKGILKEEFQTIHKKIEGEFNSGQNIYISNLEEFVKNLLILLGESGRTEFIAKVGQELDQSNSPISTKKHWAQLLQNT